MSYLYSEYSASGGRPGIKVMTAKEKATYIITVPIDFKYPIIFKESSIDIFELYPLLFVDMSDELCETQKILWRSFITIVMVLIVRKKKNCFYVTVSCRCR